MTGVVWSGLTGYFLTPKKNRSGAVTSGSSSQKTRSGVVPGEVPPQKTGPVRSPTPPVDRDRRPEPGGRLGFGIWTFPKWHHDRPDEEEDG